ncbi:hypothetical protein TNCV_4301661 [Trichonephila clavipes]|uniref:Uncharacterized protein n=1 Tax=Trichonephila clavipes TaxID=2585209 RepID=A0A8X6RX26_TRICX|nr:hypothetical protein TNCV_4301661 [Trichonephila clavipes]
MIVTKAVSAKDDDSSRLVSFTPVLRNLPIAADRDFNQSYLVKSHFNVNTNRRIKAKIPRISVLLKQSNSDSEGLSAARQWGELNTDTPNLVPPEFIFQGHPGLNFCPDIDDIFQLFEYLIDDGTQQIICNETNRYASHSI